MIFLHGAMSTGAELQPFVDAMAPYAAVRTPDLPGHAGRPLAALGSMRAIADDLAAWMDREGIEKDVVGGYSFGGTVALHFARHHPSRVSGVVALAAKHDFDAASLELWRRLLGHGRIEGVVLPGGVRQADDLARLHAPNRWQDVADANAALFAGFAAEPPLSQADLQSIRVPVMVVSSNLDRIVPWEETLALGRALPDAHVAMFVGLAHPMRKIPLLAIARNIHQWMIHHQLVQSGSHA